MAKADPARTAVTIPLSDKPDQNRSPFVLVLSGSGFGNLYRLSPGRAVSIGRGEEADIQLEDEGVSRIHCSLEGRGTDAILRDLGSQNGTFVAGERIVERILENGDRFQIGAATTFKFAWADEVEANYQRRLAEIALRDPLTGLYNRRHFRERLESEFAGARRFKHPLSLVIADIDHLNRVNEVHGRPAGDNVLRGLARTFEGLARGGDVVARIAGDEFALLLRETDLSGAEAMAKRLHEQVQAMRVRFADKEIAVTACFGIAVDLPDHARKHDESGDLMNRAGRALDRVKELGDNSVGT